MTGVASANPWPIGTVGQCAHLVTSGYTPRGGAANYIPEGPLLLRSQNVQMLRLDLSDCAHLPEPTFAEMARVHIEPGDVLLNITGKGTAGRVTWVARPDLRAAVNQHVCIIRCDISQLTPPFLAFLLSTPRYQTFFDRAPGSTRSGISHAAVRSLRIPLPPLPVQERIVAILEKADEIRRKRQEALQIADQILPALFIEMFGDPTTNPKGWPLRKLADVTEFLDSKRRPISERVRQQRIEGKKPEALYPYYGANGQVGWIDSYLFDEDLVLLAEDCGAFGSTTEPIAYRISGKTWVNNHAHVLRPIPGLTTVDYLYRAIAVRPDISPLISGTTRSKLNMTCAKTIPVPLPPFELQQRFADYVSAYESVHAKLQASLCDAESAFNVLLQRAFTGELTAEWEARNADWIAQRQAFYERLPQLVLLAFLHEKAQQARKAGVLITALMKYAFLLQMEGSSRRRLYNFVPYHYGPFAQEVYSDLENLQQQGLVTIEAEGDKTRISLAAPDKAEQALLELPEDLRQDVAAIVETYGNLDHERLLKIVYERYPAYAKKSRRRSAGKRR